MERDLYLQATSSWYNNEFILALTPWIASLFSALFWLVSSSNTLCLSWSLDFAFPKAVRLQLTRACLHHLIFSKSRNMGLPSCTGPIQTSRMVASHVRWVTHFSSNLCEIIFRRVGWFRFRVLTRIGTWSEYEDWRWWLKYVESIPSIPALHMLDPSMLEQSCHSHVHYPCEYVALKA